MGRATLCLASMGSLASSGARMVSIKVLAQQCGMKEEGKRKEMAFGDNDDNLHDSLILLDREKWE